MKVRIISQNENYRIREDGILESGIVRGSRKITDEWTQLKPIRAGRDLAYLQYIIRVSGKTRNLYAHRLVADAFCEKREGKTDVNHIDGNKKNNIASNLEWCTKSENIVHAMKNGLHNVAGESSIHAKLDDMKVLTIRTIIGMSEEMSSLYSVSTAAIEMARSGKTWLHLPNARR